MHLKLSEPDGGIQDNAVLQEQQDIISEQTWRLQQNDQQLLQQQRNGKKVDKKFEHIGLKDDILEASSPTCHMTKLLPTVELETCQNLFYFSTPMVALTINLPASVSNSSSSLSSSCTPQELHHFTIPNERMSTVNWSYSVLNLHEKK